MNPSTDDVRAWLRAIDGQKVTPEMVADLVESLLSALDFIDDLGATPVPSSRHPLYPK